MTLSFLKKKKFSSRRAVVLVEAMVGITLISFAIAGPLYVAMQSAFDIRESRYRYDAIALAEQAVELIRQRRDSVFLDCANSGTLCTASPAIEIGGVGTGNYEVQWEQAWRLFKNSFKGAALSDPTCYSGSSGATGHRDGCIFDIYDVVHNSSATTINRRFVDSIDCQFFSQDFSRRVSLSTGSNFDFLYGCSDDLPPTATPSPYHVEVEMLSVASTTLVNGYDDTYDDDVRVKVTVNFHIFGLNRTIHFTDFVRPRGG